MAPRNPCPHGPALTKCRTFPDLLSARTKVRPPPFVFQNPLDYTHNAPLVLAEAYSRLGHVVEARELLEQADAVIPKEHHKERIASYRRMEADVKVAQAEVRSLRA